NTWPHPREKTTPKPGRRSRRDRGRRFRPDSALTDLAGRGLAWTQSYEDGAFGRRLSLRAPRGDPVFAKPQPSEIVPRRLAPQAPLATVPPQGWVYKAGWNVVGVCVMKLIGPLIGCVTLALTTGAATGAFAGALSADFW